MSNDFRYLLIMIVVHVITLISVLSNFPILRQISGFIYLMFVPGFAILRILRLKERDILLTVLFSTALSIAFLMFIGLVINMLSPFFGISQPLTLIPMTITLMCVSIVLVIVGYSTERGETTNLNLSFLANKGALRQAFLLVLPPVFGIAGAVYKNAILLLIMIVIAAVIFALPAISTRLLPIKWYPWAIFSVGLALLLHTVLISKYTLGWDINVEYYVFSMTQNQGFWQPPGILAIASSVSNIQSCLSVTILPAIFSTTLNIDADFVFKLVFVFVFSLLPLALYRIYELQTNKKVALFSVFLFMSLTTSFYGLEPLSLDRQIIAELFLALSVFLLVYKKIELRKRLPLFCVFGFAIIVSHYSIAYLYLLSLGFVYLLSLKDKSKDVLRLPILLLFVVVTLVWYTFVSNSPTMTLVQSFENFRAMFFSDLLNTEARSSVVTTYLNPSTASSIIGLTHRLLIYAQNFMILAGIAVMILVKKNRKSFTSEYSYISLLSALILLASFALPNFAPTLNLSRFYAITLLFLAPFYVLGGIALFDVPRRFWSALKARFSSRNYRVAQLAMQRNSGLKIVSAILIVTFLFQVGFVNYLTRSVPLSYSLDFSRFQSTSNLMEKISFYEAYIPEQDVFGSRWIYKNIHSTSQVYADWTSRNGVLTAYGLISREKVELITNVTVIKLNSLVFLRLLNTVDDVMVTYDRSYDTLDIAHVLDRGNKIYCNGGAEIYYFPEVAP